MADSDITVSGLVATHGIGHIALQYSTNDPHEGGLLNLSLDVVEVHASTTNDRAGATKVAEGNKTAALHVALLEGTTWFYWIKARNRQGYYGDWYPSGATSGVQATVGFAASASQSLINGKLAITVASNAVTCAVKTLSGDDPSALNPVTVAFRNPSLSSAAPVFRQITSALSLTLPSGAAAGFTANDPSRLWWCVFDVGDGGVILAARNCSVRSATAASIFPLAQYGLATTILNDTSADSAGVFYAAQALNSKPFRIVGYSDWNSGLATPGTWSVAPDVIQMFGPGVKTPGDEVQSTSDIEKNVINAAGENAIGFDDTIPQNTEGVAVTSVSITPTSPVNIIDNVLMYLVSSGAGGGNLAGIGIALFKDSDVDAIAAFAGWSSGTYIAGPTVLSHRRRAATTSQITFSGRVGPLNSASATMRVNGDNFSLGRIFGGSVESTHVARELMS